MCGRLVITTPPDAMRDVYKYPQQPNFPARFNVAPTQPVPIVRLNHAQQREFALVRWGLVPSWSKELPTTPLINARATPSPTSPLSVGPFAIIAG